MARAPGTSPRVVRSLAQVRALSDPRKLRLLQAFAAAPRTILEVAGELGLTPTSLYRHVHALTRLGLLRVTAERQKRGTVERTYAAVARAFEFDPTVFDPDRGNSRVTTTFRQAERDFRAACELGIDPASPTGPTMIGLKISGTPAEIARFRRRLLALAKAAAPRARVGRSATDAITAGALIAFYPISSTDR